MSRAEDLYNHLFYMQDLTNEEILQLEKDIDDFFKSDEPEEDKEELAGYVECLGMICSAIREGSLENRKPVKPTKPRKRVSFELEIPEFLKRKIKENEEKEVTSTKS